MKGKLGIYARQSRPKETNNSIEDQIEQGQGFAEQLKMDFNIYCDRGKTAATDSLKHRPEFEQLLEDIKAGIITAVYVMDLSRLARNERLNLELKEVFEKYKIKVYTIIDGVIDYNDSSCVMLYDFRSIINITAYKDQKFKVKSVLNKRASQGKAHGGVFKPYGYKGDEDKNLVIDVEEAAVVSEIYQLCLQGFGSSKIAKILTERNIPTKSQVLNRGRKPEELIGTSVFHNVTKWAAPVVLKILQNSIYKGDRNHKGNIYSAPVIIEPDLWEQAQVQIKRNRNKPGLSRHKYLLKDLCYCKRCGSPFCGRTRVSRKDHVYKCSSPKRNIGKCGIRGINIDTLESTVWFLITKSEVLIAKAKDEVNKLKNPEYLKDLRVEKERIEKSVLKEIKHQQFILDAVKEELMSDEVAKDRLVSSKECLQQLRNKLNSINQKIQSDAALVQKVDEVKAFVSIWTEQAFSNEFQYQYEIVRMFIEKIIIDFEEDKEIFTLEVHTKLPDLTQIQTVHLSANGMLLEKPEEGKRLPKLKNVVKPVKNKAHKKSFMLVEAVQPNFDPKIFTKSFSPHNSHSNIGNGMVWTSKGTDS
ncbi:recombinase family protein [Desertivirga arenae]|uniref:recombinase family protein n=1 Tax=Desertivirga arenae TaxID=2810309 RepID=UPI001A96D932|nr:recombinase family protein [Pedobacter sp. SYSU D00823]